MTFARRIRRVAFKAAGILLAFEVLYLVLANGVVATGLLPRLVNQPNIHLSYRRAWSLWPGQVQVRDFKLRVEDYNVQFQVAIERVSARITLHELVSKTFHARHVDATGTSFRMRHKVHGVGEDGPRLAAFPKIDGFSDPALYVGPPPPPISDADYNLWKIRVDDVTARLTELWILEYRYQGDGVAKGSFALKPARRVSVEPASLSLDGGRLTLGDVVVGERFDASIGCSIPDLDVRAAEGLAVVRAISATIKARLGPSDLRFANAYLQPREGVSLEGTGAWTFDLALDAGRVVSGSRAILEAPSATFVGRTERVSGPLTARLDAGEKGMRVQATSKRLDASNRSKSAPPHAEGVDLSAAVRPRDLSKPLELSNVVLEVDRLDVPAFEWFTPFLRDAGSESTLSGAGTLHASLASDEHDFVSGRVRSELRGFGAATPSFRMHSNADVSLVLVAKERGSVGLVDVTLAKTVVTVGGRTTPAFSVALRAPGIWLPSFRPFVAQGRAEIQAEHADAWLALVVPDLVRTIATAALGLGDFRGQADFLVEGSSHLRLELPEGKVGALTGKGFLDHRNDGSPTGTLLVKGPVNVGVRLRAGTVETSTLVSDDWLPANALKLGRTEGGEAVKTTN